MKESTTPQNDTIEQFVNLDDSDGISKVFFSEFNARLVPLENRKIISVIDSFINDFADELSNFLGKKAQVKFNEIDFCPFEEVKGNGGDIIISSFPILPQNQHGIIFFERNFLISIIDLLYGSSSKSSNKQPFSIGKVSFTIAKKVTEICLLSLQKSIIDYNKIETSLLKTADQLRLVLNQPLQDGYYNLSFNVDAEHISGSLNITVPEKIIKDMTVEDESASGVSSQNPASNHTLKNELIDASVSLAVVLPEIKLNLKAIMELKSGDLISIGDPTIAYLVLNHKKLFKVSVGQENSLRVVKMIESVQGI